LALNGAQPEALAVKVQILARQSRYAEAEEEIARALELAPDLFEVNNARAALYFRQGMMREAKPYYLRASELNEVNCGTVGMLLTTCRATNDTELGRVTAQRAIDRAERVLAAEPDNCGVISWFVNGLAYLGEHDRAREWIERAIILDPGHVAMRYNFACVLVQELNDPNTALDLLETAFSVAQVSLLNWVKADPDLDPIRDHPRFKAMLEKAEARLAE
jgi:adenylate cyclase